MLTDEQLAEIYAEGMEAAACGLLMKDGPRGTGRRWEAWASGYREALREVSDGQTSQSSIRD